MNKKLFILLLSCCLPLAGMAQSEDDEKDPPIDYAYQNTLEFFGGPSWIFGHYDNLMDKGLGCFGKGVTDGANFQLRFSHFFGRKWGGFVQFSFSPIYGEEKKLGKRMMDDSQVQGDKWSVIDWCDWGHYGGGCTYGDAIVGVVYRYDFGNHWSLRPRVGIGYRSMGVWGGDETISRNINPNVTEHYHYVFSICDRHGNEIDRSRTRRWACKSSLQLQFTPRHHLFFSAEVGWSSTMGHLYQSTTRHHYFEEEAHVEGLYRRNEITISRDQRVNRVRQMGNFLDLSFGIGWNIGWNRNDPSHRR